MKQFLMIFAALLLVAGTAWAEESTASDLEAPPGAACPEGTVAETVPLASLSEAELAEWAKQGDLELFTPSPTATQPPLCPTTSTCGNCTGACAFQNTGNTSCCVAGGPCLACAPGKTIWVTRCNCSCPAGGCGACPVVATPSFSCR